MVKYYHATKDSSNVTQNQFLATLQKVLEERIPEDLDISLQSMEFVNNNRIEITLSGPVKDDLTFVSNILKEQTGQTFVNEKVRKNTIVRGIFQGVGDVGFGIFVDVGIEQPVKQVLLPLFRLREQLADDQKMPLKEIIYKYGFCNNLPVEVEISKITFEKGGKRKFEAKLTEATLDQLYGFIDNGRDIIYTTGAARQAVKKVVAKRGHTKDVEEIQRLGPLETAIILKQGTYAPGIVPRIGPYLPQCRLSMFIPRILRRYWKNYH